MAGLACLGLAGCGGGDGAGGGGASPESTTEASVSEQTSVEYDDGLTLTLQGVEDNTQAVSEQSEEVGGWGGEGADMAVRVTWLVHNNGDEAIPVEIVPSTMAMSECFQTEDRTAGGDLEDESGLFSTDSSDIPTLLEPGASFEYFDTCVLNPEETPWAVTVTPHSLGEGEYPAFTFTDADTLMIPLQD